LEKTEGRQVIIMDLVLGPRKLVFIRHGESLRNKYGHTPFLPKEPGAIQEILRRITDHGMPLTEMGLNQAMKTGVGLKKRFGVPDIIMYSDYLRAMQTTEAILSAYTKRERNRIVAYAEEACRERCLGPVHNMTLEESKAMFSDIGNLSRKMTEFSYRPPQGESLADTTERARAFLSLALKMGSGYETMFVVSHYRFIQCANWVLSGLTEYSFGQIFYSDEMKLENCGIVVYKFDRDLGRMVMVEYGTTFYDE